MQAPVKVEKDAPLSLVLLPDDILRTPAEEAAWSDSSLNTLAQERGKGGRPFLKLPNGEIRYCARWSAEYFAKFARTSTAEYSEKERGKRYLHLPDARQKAHSPEALAKAKVTRAARRKTQNGSN